MGCIFDGFVTSAQYARVRQTGALSRRSRVYISTVVHSDEIPRRYTVTQMHIGTKQCSLGFSLVASLPLSPFSSVCVYHGTTGERRKRPKRARFRPNYCPYN